MLRIAGVIWMIGAFSLGPLCAVSLRTDEDNARYLFEKGEMSLLKGDTSEALERYGKAAGRYKGTASGAASQLRIIEIEEGRHRWVAAFDACQDFFDGFPGSSRFADVLETQIRIALRVQTEKARSRATERRDGGKEKKGMARLPDDDSVSKMFRLVLENGAHTDLEPRIRYNLGVALEREERPKSARAAFAELIEFHRGHYLADDAAFQMAYIDYKKVLRGEQGRLFAAQLAFEDFLQRYEKSEKVAEARFCLAELGKREAASLWSQARYYEGLGKVESALIYYDKLFAEYAGGSVANESLRAHVRELRATLPEGEIKRALPTSDRRVEDSIWLLPLQAAETGIGGEPLEATTTGGGAIETTTTGEAP